ncbi:MAG: MFS transporter, partial [Patescibacteria group bacterium]
MKHNRKIIYLAGFLFSIPVALTSYINSSFLENYLNAYYVSIIYVLASVLTILALLEMPRMLTHFGNRKTILLFSAFIVLAFLGLALGKNAAVIVSAFVLYFISLNLIFASLDIFIEDFSENSSTGSIRGLYLMVINSAWVIAQLISGSIIAKSSFHGIYLFSAGLIILFSAIFVLFLRNFKDPEYRKVPVLKTVKIFIKNKNISKIYLVSFILKFFFAWMIIYTPIYLHTYMHFGWDQIGIIFSIMLLPFVILTYPFGKLSDKIGEKKMLFVGFLISAFFTLLIPFMAESKLFWWAGILFMTRVGAATIEVMSESYFFKSIREEDDDEISFFRNTNALSYIVAPLVAIPILMFVPSFKYLFVVLSAILLAGAFLALRLRDV